MKKDIQEFILSREPNKILVNLSNHPRDSWSEKQLEVAEKQFGEVVDIPFPNIAPSLNSEEVLALVKEYSQKVLKINPLAIHVMGEMTFTMAMVLEMKALGVPCFASTSERNVVLTDEGKKEVTFNFVQFRKYF